jgi:hypothetical protein
LPSFCFPIDPTCGDAERPYLRRRELGIGVGINER